MTAAPPLSASDTLWFRRHPDREYRLRGQAAGEAQAYPAPEAGWTIARRQDGAKVLFGCADDLTAMDPTDDQLRHAFTVMRALRQPHLQ